MRIMMKIKIMTFLLILILGLSACEGAAMNTPQDDQQEPNEEIGDLPVEEGFDFTEDDLGEDPPPIDLPENDDPSGDSPMSDEEDPGMVFPEDEAEEITEDPAVISPPEGESNWEITYEDGTIVCPTFTETFGEGEVEIVKINTGTGLDQFFMTISEPNIEDSVALARNLANPVAEYIGEFRIPGTSDKLLYQIFFDNLEGGSIANYMYGTISSEAGGCLTTRDFTGVLVN
jgi:hypothetical protein